MKVCSENKPHVTLTEQADNDQASTLLKSEVDEELSFHVFWRLGLDDAALVAGVDLYSMLRRAVGANRASQ